MGQRQGEGSVYQRHTKDCPQQRGTKTCACPWVAALDFGSGANRLRKTRYAATKRDAYRKLDELKLTRSAGVIPSNATLTQWLDYWLATLATSDLKPSTITYYKTYVAQWLKPTIGSVRLSKLGPEHVRMLHQAMAKKSPTTIRNAHAVLRRALRLALVERRVSVNWAKEVGGPAAADNPHPILTLAEAGNVFVKATRDARELARAHVAILCGLRQGEALALRWEDVRADEIRVDWSAARVDGKRIRQRPKTERSRRRVPLAPAAHLSLEAWRTESGGTGYVFHGHDGPESIEDASRDHKAWKALLTDAKVPQIPLHGARGTCATLLMSQGFAERVIADYLGQADVRVLMEHYLHSNDEERRAGALALGAAFEVKDEPQRDA